MKRLLFPAVVVLLSAVFYLWSPGSTDQGPEIFMEKDGQLLIPQHNVAIVVLDLQQAGLRLTRASDIIKLRKLQDEFALLGGVSKIESILNASRVISEADDIIVSRAIPADDARVTDRYLRQLAMEIHDYPELTPFVNRDLDTLLFYIYYGNRTPTIDIYRDLKALQSKREAAIPFEFTGRAPIIAETESLLTGDVLLFLPILAVMVLLVFSLFRSAGALIMSVVLMLLSVALSYGFVRFLGIPDSPLILLIPVFSLGLLSDYLLHYFYHCFHTHSDLEPGGGSLKKSLLFPLSLTALSTITGFLSLSLINGSGHLQLGFIIGAAVLITWGGVFFWIDYWDFPGASKPLLTGFMHAQGRLFSRIARYRYLFFAVIAFAVLWGGIQLSNLTIEPYPIGQLPPTTTIRKADTRINEEFYGTLPFFLEVDTGTKQGLLNKEAMVALNNVHNRMEEAGAGYAFSVLTVLKRMNYYFMGDEESLLTSTEFDDFYDALIEQYLLYYSSSVDPLEYSSLLDNSYRFFSIKGLLYYNTYKDLNDFIALTGEIQEAFPEGWTLSMHGMAKQLETEHNNLRNNWLISFLSGSIMIFATVLLFYRKLGLALISLVPGVISMIISFGFISMAGISVDAFSIIFVAIVTGLVIDYSIHTLVALDQISEVKSLEEGFRAVIGYSGIPIFLSFITSTVSFSVLFLSSFSGARSLGFLLLTSLVLSFFLSLYLLPLIILPFRLKKERNGA
jgi:uncharacterized protein